MTTREDVRKLVDTAVETYGRIDVLINNAGLMPLSPMDRLKVDEWDRMIDVNLKGVLYGVAAALPHMQAQRSGHIINLSSVAGHKLFAGSTVYSATKPPCGSSRTDREEMAPHNIRVTIFSPGAVKTELLDHISEADVREANQGYVGEVGVPAETLARLVALPSTSPRTSASTKSCSGRRPRRSERKERTRRTWRASPDHRAASASSRGGSSPSGGTGWCCTPATRPRPRPPEEGSQVEGIVEGDLETLAGMRAVAEQVNALGRLDAVIHNAGVGERGTDRLTADGVPMVFAVNVLAPHVLTALIERPDRLVYLSSSMHSGARPAHLAAHWQDGRWVGRTSYSQSVLVTALAFAVARLWPEVCSNAVDPGWVPTRMGGSSAPDDLERSPDARMAGGGN